MKFVAVNFVYRSAQWTLRGLPDGSAASFVWCARLRNLGSNEWGKSMKVPGWLWSMVFCVRQMTEGLASIRKIDRWCDFRSIQFDFVARSIHIHWQDGSLPLYARVVPQEAERCPPILAAYSRLAVPSADEAGAHAPSIPSGQGPSSGIPRKAGIRDLPHPRPTWRPQASSAQGLHLRQAQGTRSQRAEARSSFAVRCRGKDRSHSDYILPNFICFNDENLLHVWFTCWTNSCLS